MAKVNSKRQVPLTAGQRAELGVKPGDMLDSQIINGMLVLQKKPKVALSHLYRRNLRIMFL
ncbi:hypothetical protein [Endozoicomonas euniceicola]|uniref:Uncharacterized protein n=1 Tax=Endozoicomonas euniceicola TaxID=1234143 RepID=A0ABY6GRV1_9GAMM|nr:hypothetical protein [Endozoicomonas euniceicola]UYM15479.1 hypothetical protein NX720_21925 [Endozoicomonas euniceicola]